MRVNFEPATVPCVVNEVTLWHLQHGWIWNIVEVPDGRPIGVFFATLLCGDGCIVHFSMVRDLDISWGTILTALRRGVSVAAHYCDVVYATIPRENRRLISIACRLGFAEIVGGGFVRDGKPVALLKYLGGEKPILILNP